MIDHTHTKGRIVLILCIALLVSVIYSKFVLSLSMIGLTLVSLISIKGDLISLLPHLKRRLIDIVKSPVVIGLLLVFLATAISGINSEDKSHWIHHLKMRTPFLFLPIAFLLLDRVDRRWYHRIHYILVWIMTLSSIPILIGYFSQSEEMLQLIGVGKSIPTPVNHIKYSLFLAFAIISAVVLYFRGFVWRHPWERYVLLGLIVYLFIMIHILAVRSGIAVLYICLILLALKYIFSSRNYFKGLLSIAVLIAFPLFAYYLIPSFQKKIHYMVYDLKMYAQGSGENYSDSERLRSYQVGLELWKEQPIMGTGIGDLYKQCVDQYMEAFGNVQVTLYPHNQFIFILTGMGVIGLILFVGGLATPLIYRANYRESLFLCLYIILIASFLVENTLERSFSTGFFIFFILLGVNHLNKKGEVDEVE